jgi:hypothetical protein
MRSGEPLPASTNVVAVLGVLRLEERDEVPFIGIKFRFGLDIGEEGMDGKSVSSVFSHGGVQTGRASASFESVIKFLLKILLQIIALVLTDVILSGGVIDE